MSTRLFFQWMCMFILTLFMVSIFAQNSQTLLQEGLLKENGEGDLEAAIAIYEEILSEADADRPIRAKAQLRIALCKEKLGLQEAEEEYQKVIDQYPEQQQEVTVAEERLSEIAELAETLENISHQPTFKRIQIPTTPGNGVLSHDGKELAFVSEGSIWIAPVQGNVSPDIIGEPVRLSGTEGVWQWGMNWSADGQWIVYNTWINNTMGICVVSTSGDMVNRIVDNYSAGNNIHNRRLSISPDGEIVAYTSEIDGKLQLLTIAVHGGDVNQLTEDGGMQPAFSPDGKRIAFVKEIPQDTQEIKSDVWVMPATGGSPVQVSNLPGRATGPIWSSDGEMIAFTRKTTREDWSKEICIVPVSEDANPNLSPGQIELPQDTWDFLAGWTPDNEIGVLLTNPQHQAIYTIPSAGGNATQVTPQGYSFHPRWSPVGDRIYFRWDRGNIVSVPSEGGDVSGGLIDEDAGVIVAVPGGGNTVSPDGESIAFSGGKSIWRNNETVYEVDIYKMPVEGGEPEKLTASPGQDRFPCWSPDGKSIAFIRYREPTEEDEAFIMNVCIVDKAGGEVRQLTSASDQVAYSDIAWSPDGNLIAYFSIDGGIRIMPVEGGEYNEIIQIEDVNSHSELAWSPDGNRIIYSSKGSVWSVPLDGDEPEEIETGLDAHITHISYSPDGKKIAFTAFKGGDTHLWLMEDFLPLNQFSVGEKSESFPEQKSMTIRQVWTGPDVNTSGEISPDGKYLSFTEYNTSGDLAIREIETGSSQPLTNEGDWSQFKFAHTSKWSPDGKFLAYTWSIGKGNELRIIGIDDSEPRILYTNKEFNCVPLDWTPDGNEILATFLNGDQDSQIGLISIADGSVRFLKTLDRSHFPLASVSPDGHDIVYDFPTEEGSSQCDISLISIDGEREIPLVNHPADDRFLSWTPDGKNILFSSNRSGTYDMWCMHVTDGSPLGDPVLIKKDIGQILPIGFNQQGSFYYGTEANIMDVFMATFDLEKGTILSPPKEISQHFVGSNLTPDWSPDGEQIAYISMRNTEQSGPNTCVLCIRSEQTGEIREIYTPFMGTWILRWSPDGESIFIAAQPNEGSQGIYNLDLQDGNITSVAQSDTDSIIKDFAFSPDGNTLFYVHYQWKKENVSIIRHDLTTGQETEVYRKDAPPDIGGVLVSPDGQYISFGTFESENSYVIQFIPIAGGEPGDLFRMESNYAGQSAQYVWTPAGNEILVVKAISSMNDNAYEIWRIPVRGGEAEKMGLSNKRILLPRFHPDGKRIIFMTFKSIDEIWVIENFLSLLDEEN